MSVLSDATITDLCTPPFRHELVKMVNELDDGSAISQLIPGTVIDGEGEPMINPFVPHLVREVDSGAKIISYGLTSYGYDVRLKHDRVLLFTNANGGVIDPMNPTDDNYVEASILWNEEGMPYFILPPNSYALASTVEWFNIPKNVTVIAVGKSTYARSAVQINTTPIEAGFRGTVVIEIANSSTLPVKVYLATGIAQFIFLRGDRTCTVSYADGKRKYQNQEGIVLSRV